MRIFLPNHVKKCLKQLNSNSFSAFCVGGAVRDSLLGANPDDYDIATSATPEQVMELFERVIPTGIKHGTVTVIIDDIPIEVTTFRNDGEYSDSRHPEKVNFVGDINSDLSRRDFTVNAFAYSADTGLIDNFGGIDDLNQKVIRCVGDPNIRFNEDALRILRAFRFCSVLNFSMDKATLGAAIELSHLLNNISRERIYVELSKLLCGKKPEIITDLLSADIPGYLKPKKLDLNIINALGKTKPEKNIRFCFFCLATGLEANNLFDNLKADNKTKQTVCTYLDLLKSLPLNNKTHIKKALCKINPNELCDLLENYGIVFNYNVKQNIADIKQIISQNEPYLIKHLNISGDDIKLCGAKERKVGQILNCLLDLVIENPTLNTHEKLTELAKKYI